MEQSLHITFPPQIPKYLSVAGAIANAIRDGEFIRGQKLPSINELSEKHLLARDTVGKAYKELRRQGILESVKGKGYFISRVDVDTPLRILLIFNKISNYKKQIYNAFVQTLGNYAKVDLQIHHINLSLFENIILNNPGIYNYYVIMPHFYEQPDKVLDILSKIPEKQLVLLDKDLPEFKKSFA